MRSITLVVFALLMLNASMTWGQTKLKEPHIGYLYPAGGRQGMVLQVVAGGQHLKGVSDLYISGEGVHASKVRFMGSFKRLKKEQRQELEKRLAMLKGTQESKVSENDWGESETEEMMIAEETDVVEMPNHPMLNNLESLSSRELEMVENEFLIYDKKKQPNAQIAEIVMIEISIDPDTAPGDRYIRLQTTKGLTNPLCFQVGQVPEILEEDPYDEGASTASPVNLPVVFNGQIRPGDVDRFQFHAQQGQRLVIDTKARHLIPYLADAVPGWFQALLSLYDANGMEVAFVDDFRFNPDPVLFYQIPETGCYELEIRDSIFRGREDFVYRITVGEHPFIKSIFPLGGKMGEETKTTIDGWNLRKKRMLLDTQPGKGSIRETVLNIKGCTTNPVTYAVDTLEESFETEPNDDALEAQPVDLPVIINGRIANPDDRDLFKIKGCAGDELVAEVLARRLNSPLDSQLQLMDAKGQVLSWNDDHTDKAMGLVTHHADSYLRWKLPEDGEFILRLLDSQDQGGKEYGYRLRIESPRPDFTLCVTPSNINVPAGRIVSFCVHVFRKDGFNGDIDLALNDAPTGFSLSGGRIPGTLDRIRVTLKAPEKPPAQPVALRIEGRTTIDGERISRPAFAAEDMMQAFLYRHLVPMKELLVTVTGSKRRAVRIEPATKSPVQIPVGGKAQVCFKIPKRAKLKEIQLDLYDPPEGIILREVTFSQRDIVIELEADLKKARPGCVDNLIFEVFTKSTGSSRKGKAGKKDQRVSLGVLPAIPIEIIQP